MDMRRLLPAAVLAALAILLAARAETVPLTTAQADDEAPLRALAERLLALPYPFPSEWLRTPQLLPGILPNGLPMSLPLPPRAVVVGSAAYSSGDTLASADTVLDVPGSANDLLAFYRGAMAALGWSPPPGLPSSAGQGFLPEFSAASYCSTPSGPWLAVFVLPGKAAGESDLRLHVDLAESGPCANPTQPSFEPDPNLALLPALSAPAGVRVTSISTSSGGGHASSEGIAETDLSVAELEAAYAAQLEAAGWTRLAGGADGPVAWSAWSLPAGEQTRGFLIVLDAPGERCRDLIVRVESPPESSGHSGSSASSSPGSAAACAGG